MFCASCVCIVLSLIIDPTFVFRQQCELFYHCVKSRPHLIKSGSCTTMSSFSQAGSSTTHTTTSSPQHLCSVRTNVNLHIYLCRVEAHLHAASDLTHAASSHKHKIYVTPAYPKC
ncbi:hypothetical protein BDR03DRAFT_961143 [Suillus americanus]|nr:hypothetical protein BDR03DRAFT_961143 [Suillus americanus]